MNKLLTVGEAAAALNVSERWMRRAIFEQRFDVVHLGRLVRIPTEALEAYIENNRQTAQKSDRGVARHSRPVGPKSAPTKSEGAPPQDATATNTGGQSSALTSLR